MIHSFLIFLSYISYAYIVFYGCTPFLLDQSILTLKFKIVTSILLGISVAILIIKQILDKKKEERIQEEEIFDREEMKSGINALSNQQISQETEKRENLKTGDKVLPIIKAAFDNDIPTLVYCHAGMDRSPFMIACFIHKELGFSIEHAYKIVKEGRPQTIIHDDWMRFYKEMNE